MPKLKNTSSQNNEFMFYSDYDIAAVKQKCKKIVFCVIKIENFLNAYEG